jgi:hypothetical protein
LFIEVDLLDASQVEPIFFLDEKIRKWVQIKMVMVFVLVLKEKVVLELVFPYFSDSLRTLDLV